MDKMMFIQTAFKMGFISGAEYNKCREWVPPVITEHGIEVVARLMLERPQLVARLARLRLGMDPDVDIRVKK